ncbi:MAG: VIT1/CCC1 transporter family protein [candidate division KSB1 bacterium]|nr:VIT1/CCC1 transporter family protein [candidate division KSB1 bacterium]
MLTRSLDKAREAYKRRDVEAGRAAHLQPPEAHREEQGKYIKSLVYGGLDGIITTFAVVAGVAGASLSSGVALILGVANLVADGLSMAVGDYLSTRAENEYKAAERQREAWEVAHFPEGERLEMVELYEGKGISRADAEAMADILAKYPRAWVEVMMAEELGLVGEDESPLANAVMTFVSFALFGFLPLAAFFAAPVFGWVQDHLFATASIITGAALFVLGAFKVRITGQSWLRSGFEMLLVGGLAAAAAYFIGDVLAGWAKM